MYVLRDMISLSVRGRTRRGDTPGGRATFRYCQGGAGGAPHVRPPPLWDTRTCANLIAELSARQSRAVTHLQGSDVSVCRWLKNIQAIPCSLKYLFKIFLLKHSYFAVVIFKIKHFATSSVRWWARELTSGPPRLLPARGRGARGTGEASILIIISKSCCFEQPPDCVIFYLVFIPLLYKTISVFLVTFCYNAGV